MKDINEEIIRLQDKIAKLPSGYISKKTIYGKTRQYYQWMEDGKKKSKYVDEETSKKLNEGILLRRSLQKELKELKMKTVNKDNNEESYHSIVLTGLRLKDFVRLADTYKRRPLIEKIVEYLNSDVNKVLILYGLRRTGKTTLIQQSIASFSEEDFDKTAFIQIKYDDNLSLLNKDLKKLQSLGYKYIFIDEVTLMEDFIEGAALFSDIYVTSGMRIILSGTDSLGFLFSEDEQLYDRCIMLHTTFISYKEFSDVLGIEGIDEYIKYGGTMSLSGVNYNKNSTFANIKSTDEYIDSAIARNIQHSLKYYQYAGHFRSLEDLYNNNELTSAINRVVEDINHRFTIEVLTNDFVSHDLGLSAKNLRNNKSNPNDILDNIDKEAFTRGLKESLEIKNKVEQTVKIEDIHRLEIKQYLDLLDLTVDILVESLPVSNKKEYMTVISQPGLRYSQADALIKQLLLDEKFKDISVIERKRIIERIQDEIKGRMMEEIVLLETKKALADKQVFKLKFAVGEFDMVVCDSGSLTCQIYEIKHSDKAVKNQYRHLIDENKCAEFEFRFGKITNKIVIYRGESKYDGEIEYKNVEEYLRSL